MKIINCLYEHFKDSPKKLKIICDWSEVIQPYESFALWKTIKEINNEYPVNFTNFFTEFWKANDLDYSSFQKDKAPKIKTRQIEIKNSPNFYQEAPFLTIAEDLLRLIKEDKVEQLIFLSAYDKRKFPNGDERKWEIFAETFGRIYKTDKTKFSHAVQVHVCKLQLIGFDSKTQQGQTKADWIKENASDFDIFIDDNPNICKSIIGSDYLMGFERRFGGKSRMEVLAPHYPAIENQHHPEALLIKTSVSDLKKEDF